MYQIIGADGAPGDPVDLDRLKEMAADGRLVPATMVLDPISGRSAPAGEMFVGDELFPIVDPASTASTAAPADPQLPIVPGTAPPIAAPAPMYTSPFASKPHPSQPPAATPTYPPAQTQIYAPQPQAYPTMIAERKSKIAAGLLAIFLGGLGIHGFYTGNKALGLAFLITTMCCFGLTVITFGILGILLIPVMGLVGMVAFVQGILYLVA